jgi:hypothetical protein
MPTPELRRKFIVTLGIATVVLACSICAHAQEPPVQQLIAPPPPKAIPKDERAQLEATKDAKARVKLSLQLSENHLLTAEQYTTQGNYEAASGEIGKYHAVIDDLLKTTAALNSDKNKTRDLYKKIELALRAHGPRLTSMRRTTPLEYAVWIKEVEEFARDGRTEALNSFYGHTVVRETAPATPAPKPLNEQLLEKRKDNSLAPPEKKP